MKKTTAAYLQAKKFLKTHCKFCPRLRDGYHGQMCKECRQKYWREAQAKCRRKKERG